MNKRGLFAFSIIMGITFFIVGLAATNFLMESAVTVRASDALDCKNPAGISDGTKMTCLAIDAAVPYFIAFIFATVGTIATRRLI